MRERNRTVGEFSQPWSYERWDRSSCSSSPHFVNVTASGLAGSMFSQSVSDVVTPGFRALRAARLPLPINPFIAVKTTTTRVAGASTVRAGWNGECWGIDYRGSYWEQVQSLPPIPDPDDAIVGYVVNAAAAEAMNPVWDVATCLAEIQSTHRMITARSEALMNFAERVVAPRARRVPRNQRRAEFDKLWLEYRYGWMPMVYDAENAIKAFGSRVAEGDLVTGTSLQTQSTRSTNQVIHYFGNSTRTSNYTLEINRKYRGFALAEVLSPFNSKFGGDVAVTGWELVPFSFVIDWFVQVGDYLEATRPSNGSQRMVQSGYSIRSQIRFRENVDYQFHTSATGAISNIATQIDIDHYARFPRGVSVPGWNPRLSQLRLADLGALLTRRLARLARVLMR